MLENYSGKEVRLDVKGLEAMHEVWEDPGRAPRELSDGSGLPVNFWYLVKGMQGLGRFVRPKSEVHNEVFPEVRVVPFEGYFKQKFRSEGKP